MNSLMDFLYLIDKFTTYLQEKGFHFSEEGYPIFDKQMFLTDKPDLIVPVNQRKNRRVIKKDKTLIAFYCGDKYIYRRIVKLPEEIGEYQPYMGVIGCDITVTKDMDIEWQRTIILLNQLVMAVFAVNGIKIVLNTRMGSKETKDMFKYFPKGITIASGFRGGTRRFIKSNFEYTSKVLYFLPSKLLIYGKCHNSVLRGLHQMGIECIVYSDFRELCREVA